MQPPLAQATGRHSSSRLCSHSSVRVQRESSPITRWTLHASSMASIVAQTGRLRLRTWDEADETRFYRIMNNPAVMRWLGGVQTPEEWRQAYERLLQYERGLGFTFWIVDGGQ